MVFVLIMIMIISPQRSWSTQDYNHLRISKSREVLRQEDLHSQRLRSLFVQFQKQYLNFEFKKAQSSLKEIIDLRLLQDWNAMERKIFATSYLRLAQMDELYRYKWIDEFLAFNNDLFIDRDLFPPEFIRWVKDRHQQYQLKTDVWYGQNLPKDIKTVIINGETFNRLGFSRRIQSYFKYRVTLIEKGSQYQRNDVDNFTLDRDVRLSMILSGRDLVSYPFETSRPIAQVEPSQDTKPSLVSNSSNTNQDFVDKISKEISQDDLVIQDTHKDNVQIASEFAHNRFDEFSSVSNIKQSVVTDSIAKGLLKEGVKKQPSKGFLSRHKWFFIIFGGVAMGLLLFQTQGPNKSHFVQRQQRKKVTHREDIYY